MSLPYSASNADPHKAQGRIQSTLRKFGVGRIVFDDDVDNKTVTVMFQYQQMPVSLPINYGNLAKKFMHDEPFNSYRRCSKADYEFKMAEKAYRASYSMLEDLIKSMISIVNLGAFTFEEIFLGFFVGRNGKRVSEILVPQLKEGFCASKFLLGQGDR